MPLAGSLFLEEIDVKPTLLLFASLAFRLTMGGTVTAAGKPSQKSQKLAMEIVSIDPDAKTITMKDEKANRRQRLSTYDC
jgi:hypothetical protein